MDEMTVRCKNEKCGYEYLSEMKMDKVTFSLSTLKDKKEQCPKCHQISAYNKEDYFFR